MAGDSAVAPSSKPVMRGLLNSVIKRNIYIGVVLAALSGIMFQTMVINPKKRRYAEFYRTYDAQKEFEEMRKKGLFQSC